MKVQVFARHWGLADVLRNILSYDHEVLFDPADNTFPERYNFKYGEGDVHISTFPYDDIAVFKKDKPLIIYATDPVPEWEMDNIKKIQEWEGCTVVSAEPCYPKVFWPFEPHYQIPYGIDISKYYKWTGGIHKVAVVNRKPLERWREVVAGATGLHYTFEDLFQNIPFDIVAIEDDNEYRKALSQYDCMFYFSNSPYTIVMFEGMTIGMPIVAYNHTQHTTYKPVEKYIENRAVVFEDTRERLRKVLANPQPVTYPIMPFDTIVKKWNTIINEAYARSKRI